jgi:hypothetical protein
VGWGRWISSVGSSLNQKFFEFSVPTWGSILRLVERRKGISRVMMEGKYSVEWLKKVVEKMVFMV